MNKDDLCEKIKENLLVLGVSKNKSFDDISYFTLEDIGGLYRDIITKGHIFYFQNKDMRKNAKNSYKFFLNLFQEYGAITLGEIIPREYQSDLIGNLDKMLVDTHIMEHEIINRTLNEMKSNHLNMVKKAEETKIKNYNDFYAKNYEIKKRLKELKRREKVKRKELKKQVKERRKWLLWRMKK